MIAPNQSQRHWNKLFFVFEITRPSCWIPLLRYGINDEYKESVLRGAVHPNSNAIISSFASSSLAPFAMPPNNSTMKKATSQQLIIDPSPPRRSWTWSCNTWRWQTRSWRNKQKKRANTLDQGQNEHELIERNPRPVEEKETVLAKPVPRMTSSPKPMDPELKHRISVLTKRGEVKERVDREDSECCECKARVLFL